jgi:hypothetical protein
LTQAVEGVKKSILPVILSAAKNLQLFVFKKINADASLLLSMTAYFFTPSLAWAALGRPFGAEGLRLCREEIMSCRGVFLNRLIGWVALPSLALFLAVVPAIAQTSNSDYILLVGSGFLCESGDSSACPAVTISADGSSIELSGAGTFNTKSKSVTAAGSFTHKSSGGDVLETGVWVASELVSFDFYGIAPGALRREGRALGPPQFGPKRMGMFAGPMAAGGRAVLRIRLLPVSGLARNATLEVNCALGKVPDEHQVEGVRLAIEGGGAEFDEEISGRTLFLLRRPGAGAAAKAPAPQVETNPAPAEVQR